MKKILLCICMALGICGCNKESLINIKKADTPTVEEASNYLSEKHGLLTYHLDTTDEYDEKIENKDSFVLFVYRETCFGCDTLSPGIKTYLEENPGANIYSLDISKIGVDHTLYKDHNITGTPWIIMIDTGNIALKTLMPAFNGSEESVKKEAKTWFYDLMKNNISWED